MGDALTVPLLPADDNGVDTVLLHPPGSVDQRLLRLTQLNAATSLDDLRQPSSNRWEALSGDRAGQWSIRINDQWRVCFGFEHGDVFDVEIVDYH